MTKYIYLFFGSALWIIILVMSITATVVESAISKFDDNLLIPIFSGFNGQIVLWLMMYFGYVV